MARIDAASSGSGTIRIIAAETAPERELLAFCAAQGSELVLLGAYYPVQGDRVVLPDNISGRGARRVCQALEEAADSHRRAQRRRHRFQLIKSGQEEG